MACGVAFSEALAAVGVPVDDLQRPAMAAHIRATMGMETVDVFRPLLHDGHRAAAANVFFERSYEALVAGGGPPGRCPAPPN